MLAIHGPRAAASSFPPLIHVEIIVYRTSSGCRKLLGITVKTLNNKKSAGEIPASLCDQKRSAHHVSPI
jgi:hypothetical protein